MYLSAYAHEMGHDRASYMLLLCGTEHSVSQPCPRDTWDELYHHKSVPFPRQKANHI